MECLHTHSSEAPRKCTSLVLFSSHFANHRIIPSASSSSIFPPHPTHLKSSFVRSRFVHRRVFSDAKIWMPENTPVRPNRYAHPFFFFLFFVFCQSVCLSVAASSKDDATLSPLVLPITAPEEPCWVMLLLLLTLLTLLTSPTLTI